MSTSRRQFLTHLVAGGAAASSFSSPVWSNADIAEQLPASMRQAGNGFSNYGQPSSHEQAVIRWIAANPDMPGNGVDDLISVWL